MVRGERFVPQRTGQLTRALAELPWGAGPDDGNAEEFRAFAHLVAALYHYEFHEREHRAIDAWEAGADAASEVTAELTGLLDGANYEPVTMAELDEALSQESLIPLRLDVDLDDYDEVLIYRRGSHQSTVTVPKFRGLRQVEKIITVDERVVVHTRVKPASWFTAQGVDPGDRNLVPGHVSLKQFQNVPRADIEMLLPSTQVRFRPIDSLLVGVPALISGIAVLTTKLAPTIALIALLVAAWLGIRSETPELDQTALVVLLGGAVTLGGFVFRQWTKLKNRRVEYLKTLTENLYFRTLADGPGVLHTLLSAAEQQEVVEVLLAYRFLLAAPGATPDELDTEIEAWLRQTCHQEIDFEIDDAIAKLRRLGVIDDVIDNVVDDVVDQVTVDGDTTDGATPPGSGELEAVPMSSALATLDRRWDDLFRHGNDDGDDLGGAGRSPEGNEEAGPPRLIRLRRVVDRFAGRLGRRRAKRD